MGDLHADGPTKVVVPAKAGTHNPVPVGLVIAANADLTLRSIALAMRLEG